MEIDVTEYVENVDCLQFSNSINRSGRKDIGEVTWNNAKNHVAAKGLITVDQQDELRSWIKEFGAWTDEDIANMSDQDTNALLLQFIAGDIQEMEMFDTVEEYQKAAEDGQCSGRLCKCDAGRWYFYVGF